MQLIYLKEKEELKRFQHFRKVLYQGDPSYVSTSEFVVEDLLYQKTAFTRSCYVRPVIVEKNGKDVAEAVFIYNSRLPYLQVGFFEALENQADAVEKILSAAKKEAKKLHVENVVIGLNAHISYGVGILTRGFDYKNSFDSIYNKPYYKEYFQKYRKETLSTYYTEKAQADQLLVLSHGDVRIRHADMRNFKAETELMRKLCDKTIGRTFLYYPTQEGHFYELIKDLKPFLSGENLLFAEDKDGNAVGFMFWHPDYNRMLPAGKQNSMLRIALAYAFNRKAIDTVKINAIGSLSPMATVALLTEFSRITGDKYRYLETNFVWDNNLRSTKINKRFFGKPHRKYEVYFTDEMD